MSEVANITIDSKAVGQNIIALAVQKFPDVAKKALHEAQKQLKIDADEIPPRTPHLTGALRDSGVLGDPETHGETIEGTVAYTMPYAARWHEIGEEKITIGNAEYKTNSINWSEAGVGPKYLEAKLVNLNQKYLKLMADYIKSELGL